MDRRERFYNWISSIRALIHSERVDIWTALPGIVQSYNPATITATVQPSIQGQIRVQSGPNADETWDNVNLPVLPDVPVHFLGGGGFTWTFPLAQGDEGIIIFGARCIDGWWQLGGVQPQLDIRQHDLSDAMFIPGLFSQPRVPTSVSGTNAQLRNAAGTTLFEMTPGGAVNITAPGGFHVNGDIAATGNVTGNSGSGSSVELLHHTHTGVTTGGGTSGPPTPGS